MKKIAIIALALLAALSLGLAGKAAAGCNDLILDSEHRNVYSEWVNYAKIYCWEPDMGSIHCTHGKVETKYGSCGVELTNIGLYGPDCTITFIGKYNDSRGNCHIVKGTYRFQQNYCSTHSGRITVQHVGGRTIPFSIHEGDWSGQRPGKVTLHPGEKK
jgi:hypothetical protein